MADAQAALDETKRLIGLGNEQILRVTPENFYATAQEAWPAFRRGVVRAEGCREVPAEELLAVVEGKPQVLTYLADFAEQKKGYRKQVETVLRILLKCPQWLEVARADPALVARLPGAEVAEMLAAAASDDAATLPSAQARADAASLAVAFASAERLPMERTESRRNLVKDLQESLEALVAMGGGGDLKPTEAVEELQRLSVCVRELLERNIDADTEVLAKFEHKVPVLQVLCRIHASCRTARSTVSSLLLSLLETPSLTGWRATVDANPDLRGELEGLGLMDHAYGNDISDDKSISDEKSVTTEAHPLNYSTDRVAIWMWRDAGKFGGWLSHTLATMNPARWSNACSIEETIADLEQYLDTPQGERPVKVRVFGAGLEPTTSKSDSVAGAVAALKVLLKKG